MDQHPTDLADRIDLSFGDGPELGVHPDDLLPLGRRAARRRRAATGLGALAVAAIVGGSALALSGGDDGSKAQDSQFASQGPSPSAGTSTTPSPAPSATPEVITGVPGPRDLTATQLVGYDASGALVARRGVTITRVLENPYDLTAPDTSVGLIVEQDGETSWYALARVGESDSAVWNPSFQSNGLGFAQWVATHDPDRTGAADPEKVARSLVRLEPGGRLEALPGSTILEQRPRPDLGPDFAPSTDNTAVAEVRSGGARYYVLARQAPGTPVQYIATKAADGGPTLDSFLDFARGQYAPDGSEEGLL